MADFFTPANIFQGRGSAESAGTGTALGDIPVLNLLGVDGVDFMPNGTQSPAVGGINHQSLGILSTDATGDNPKEQPVAFLEAFQRMGANGGQFRISVQGGDEIVIPQCAYAAPGAAGTFFIAPSDVGAGPGQVPPDPTAWSAPILRPHVSAFVRDASHCRGVVSQLSGGEVAGQTNAPFPSVQVVVVNSVPVWSEWALVIDGGAQTVLFRHENGNGDAIDVRRPRDIWEQVVVPQLQKRIGQDDPLPLLRDAGVPTTANRGFISRLNYVSYARFGFFDTGVDLQPLFNPA